MEKTSSMMIDASALVAVLLGEPDADAMLDAMESAQSPITSAIAIWEAKTRLTREFGFEAARRELNTMLDIRGIEIVAVGEIEARIAGLARARFSAGRYGLNMGDCFAYACAKANGVPLLYIGNDFVKTDVNDGF